MARAKCADRLGARRTRHTAGMADNLRASLQALAISVVIVLALVAVWDLAPFLVGGARGGQ
jgi:hypothetical protein